MKTARKFEESLRLHEEKTQLEEENEDIIMLPLHFSDGDKVDEEVQSILNDMDPMDPITLDDSVMVERIQDLVQRTLNEFSRRDTTNDSEESDQNAERGSNPPSRLSSIEPSTPIAKSTPRTEAPK